MNSRKVLKEPMFDEIFIKNNNLHVPTFIKEI